MRGQNPSDNRPVLFQREDPGVRLCFVTRNEDPFILLKLACGSRIRVFRIRLDDPVIKCRSRSVGKSILYPEFEIDVYEPIIRR